MNRGKVCSSPERISVIAQIARWEVFSNFSMMVGMSSLRELFTAACETTTINNIVGHAFGFPNVSLMSGFSKIICPTTWPDRTATIANVSGLKRVTRANYTTIVAVDIDDSKFCSFMLVTEVLFVCTVYDKVTTRVVFRYHFYGWILYDYGWFLIGAGSCVLVNAFVALRFRRCRVRRCKLLHFASVKMKMKTGCRELSRSWSMRTFEVFP